MSQPTLAEGATGSEVSWLQYLMLRLVVPSSPIDGTFGPITKAAVEKFQGQQGLAADGVVGPLTWKALGGDQPRPPTLAVGSTGPVVASLQNALNTGRGQITPSNNPVLAVDGDFGPQTEVAVKGLQTQHGYAVDGIVGLQTWATTLDAASGTLASLCGVTPPDLG